MNERRAQKDMLQGLIEGFKDTLVDAPAELIPGLQMATRVLQGVLDALNE